MPSHIWPPKDKEEHFKNTSFAWLFSAKQSIETDKIIEYFKEVWTFDFVYINDYELPELAVPGSPWYPIRASEGYILGLNKQPALIFPLTQGLFTNRKDKDPAYALRMYGNIGEIDTGFTYVRAPVFYPIGLQENLIADTYGIDIGRSILSALWRLEVAYPTKNLVFSGALRKKQRPYITLV